MPRDGRATKHGHKARAPLPGKLKPKLEPSGHPDLPKVFCIGFHKTGTTSLKMALKILGYRVTGPNGRHDKNIGRNVEALARRIVPKFDAFQDNPWPIIYRFLDKEYPGSKFILTVRPERQVDRQRHRPLLQGQAADAGVDLRSRQGQSDRQRSRSMSSATSATTARSRNTSKAGRGTS